MSEIVIPEIIQFSKSVKERGFEVRRAATVDEEDYGARQFSRQNWTQPTNVDGQNRDIKLQDGVNVRAIIGFKKNGFSTT